MRIMRSTALMLVLAHSLIPASGVHGQVKRDLNPIHARLAREIRHELMMLPNYSVFDNLEFEISGVDTIALLGQVMRPTLKSDAEGAIRSMEGVGKLINRIEVLPVSPADERIRIAIFRAVFSRPPLEKYAYRAVPPIHIIVKEGSVTLVGVVASELEKDTAGMAAKEVPGTFAVTNNLRVENK